MNAAVANLVVNPSLEDGATFPTCFSKSGWGTEATWSTVAGRTGGRAVRIVKTTHTSGDRKLLQSETAQCAPAVTVGKTYQLSLYYTSNVPTKLTVFRQTASGWSFWGDLATAPASSSWARIQQATPVIPEGTLRIVYGLSLGSAGTLTVDDFATIEDGATEVPAPPTNLVANPNLARGTGTPDCFFLSDWGGHTTTATYGTVAPPTNAPAGTKAYTIAMSGYTSGDAKLIQTESAACAPSVVAGEQYTMAIDYRSTAAANSVTVFSHTAAGWGYWTDLATLPASAAWTTATPVLPPIPTGVDRISFGVSLAGNGTLSTTNYTVAKVVTPPVEASDPAKTGVWDVMTSPMPLRAIHTTLLNDGRLLLIAGSGNDGNSFAAGTFKSVVWNPTTNVFTQVPTPTDMFCSGHVTLADGKVLVAGGTAAFPAANQGVNTFKGSKVSYYFDPADNTYHQISDMAGAHWYPTLTKLGNGDVWAAGGLNEKAEGTVLTEMFDGASRTWKPSNQVPQTYSFWGTYPHMYLLADGTLFYSGGHTFGNGLPGTGASLYRWQTAQIWDVPGLREKDRRDQAGSVLLPPAQSQKVMIVGGGNTDSNAPGTNLVDVIDLSEASPRYVPGPDLPGEGKGYVNVVNLPDRTVLAANGARFNRTGDVKTAAIYDPSSNAWTSVTPDPIGRNYHSTSILLPDGRVVVFGSNPADNSFELRMSVYRPPYLFKGTRPTVTSAPTTVGYGQSIDLGVTGSVVSASLTSPMSATHQTDTNARLVDLPIAGTGATRTAQVPNNANLLPPGPYMLTVLDANRVPSVARWVWVTAASNAKMAAVTQQSTSTTSVSTSTASKNAATLRAAEPAAADDPGSARQSGLKAVANAATVNDGKRATQPKQKTRPDVAVKAVTQGKTLGGCLPEYGRAGQCLPTVPPSMAEHVQAMKDAGMDPSSMPHTWRCGEVRTLFAQGLPVRRSGRDPQRLDANLDGTACGSGDPD